MQGHVKRTGPVNAVYFEITFHPLKGPERGVQIGRGIKTVLPGAGIGIVKIRADSRGLGIYSLIIAVSVSQCIYGSKITGNDYFFGIKTLSLRLKPNKHQKKTAYYQLFMHTAS